MPHAFKAREIERRAQDGGRAAQTSRWFSSRTVKASSHYQDWSWRRACLHIGGAVALVLASRVDPTLAPAPWMLIAGVFWLVWGLRAAVLKLMAGRV